MKSVEAIAEIVQSTPPEIPPDLPFSPPETINRPAGFAPMIYPESSGHVKYSVLARDVLEVKQLEADLNEMGRDGWRLARMRPLEKQPLLVFAREGRMTKA